MNDDELRDRIGALDPALGCADPEPVTSPSARALLEEIMKTSVMDAPAQASPDRPRRPRWFAASAAAAAIGVAAVGAATFTRDGGGGIAAVPATPVAGEAAVLELDAGVDEAAKCQALDPSVLAGNEVAFRGTVTAVEGGVVELAVDEAYRGVGAPVVALGTSPELLGSTIEVVAWEVGRSYLVSAVDGVVSYCGQTGPATPELQAVFDAAFAG
jgi:hypothetical protein